MVVIYDLEERTLRFARAVNAFLNRLPKTIVNYEVGKQLIRSAGSVGANYIEANESLSKKDFIMRAKIAKKEAKESRYWLNLVYATEVQEPARNRLVAEVNELMKILGSIIIKWENHHTELKSKV
jgi:four helix bundle protein